MRSVVLRKYDGISSRTCVRFVRTGTPIPMQCSTSHNVHKGEAGAVLVRSSPLPSAAEGPILSDITSATESGQPFPDGITHRNAAISVALHVGGSVLSEQRVRDVVVSEEDRVVAPPLHGGGVYTLGGIR